MKKNFKKLFLLLVVIVTAVVCFTVSASALNATGQCGNNVTYTYNSTTGKLIISGTGSMWSYSSYKGSPFYSSNIKSVVINDGVTTIGYYAFYNCYSLTEVTIPDSVTTIGYESFYSCDRLTEVTIPDSVTTIGYSAFKDCDGLKEVTIPDSVTTIGDDAFYNCDSLTEVTIPDSVTTIGVAAFKNCDSLTDITVDENNQYFSNDEYGVLFNKDKTTLIQYPIGNKRTDYTIPDSVTTIGDEAFRFCGLKEVTIGNSVTTIGYSAFEESYSLTEVTIGDSVTTIGDDAFRFCGLKEVTIGDSVTTIGSSAFSFCSSLTEVTIGDSVTTIGSSAFSFCESLTEVTIPDSVTTIGVDAFRECDSLTDITVDENNQYFSNDKYGVLFNKDKTTLIRYPIGNKRTSYTIPYSVTTIGDFAFSWCDSLTKVTIPDSVTTIDYFAFYDCYSLTDVYYGGTQEQWKKIKIGSKNGDLTGANIHYNYCKHTESTVQPQQDATCTKIGYTEGVKCAECGKWLSGHEVIPATNHPKKESKPQQDATCTANGYTAGAYCPECEKWLSGHSTISAKGHKFTSYKPDSNATAFADGTKTALCDNGCGENDVLTDEGSKIILSKPEVVSATQSTTTIKLTWSPVDGANAYAVYEIKDNEMKKLGEVAKLDGKLTKLTAGTKHTYAVKAGARSDGKEIWSEEFITIETATKAFAPTNVSAKQTESTITLNWKGAEGADGYKIFYKVDGKWKACATVTGISHTFRNLKAGAKYDFAIQSFIKADSGVVWGEYAQFAAATVPSNPTLKVTAPSKGKLTVNWKAVNGAEGYQLWYKKGNGSYKLYKTYTKAGTLNFSNLKSGTKYTFAVRAVIKTDSGNVRSGYKSASVTVK